MDRKNYAFHFCNDSTYFNLLYLYRSIVTVSSCRECSDGKCTTGILYNDADFQEKIRKEFNEKLSTLTVEGQKAAKKMLEVFNAKLPREETQSLVGGLP